MSELLIISSKYRTNPEDRPSDCKVEFDQNVKDGRYRLALAVLPVTNYTISQVNDRIPVAFRTLVGNIPNIELKHDQDPTYLENDMNQMNAISTSVYPTLQHNEKFMNAMYNVNTMTTRHDGYRSFGPVTDQDSIGDHWKAFDLHGTYVHGDVPGLYTDTDSNYYGPWVMLEFPDDLYPEREYIQRESSLLQNVRIGPQSNFTRFSLIYFYYAFDVATRTHYLQLRSSGTLFHTPGKETIHEIHQSLQSLVKVAGVMPHAMEEQGPVKFGGIKFNYGIEPIRYSLTLKHGFYTEQTFLEELNRVFFIEDDDNFSYTKYEIGDDGYPTGEIIGRFPRFSFEVDQLEKKLKIMYYNIPNLEGSSGNNPWRFELAPECTNSGTAYSLLGFNPVNGDWDFDKTAPNLMNLNPLHTFNISIDKIASVSQSSRQGSTFIVPVPVGTLNYVNYIPEGFEQYVDFVQKKRTLEIQVRDDLGNAIDFNGIDFLIILEKI